MAERIRDIRVRVEIDTNKRTFEMDTRPESLNDLTYQVNEFVDETMEALE